MQYLYETHLHTVEGSACSRVAGADYIDYMIGRGFAGMVVTDHFFTGNCAVDRTLPWQEKIALYCEGFRRAREAAQGRDFDVIFGIEYNFNGDEFLIYGLDEKWLLDNPDIEKLDRRGVYARVHEAGGVMIHAHPFRERGYLKDIKLTPEICDGIEVYNAANTDNQNALAYEYAEKLGLPMIGGSDLHYFHDNALGGVQLPYRVSDTFAFAKAFLAGDMTPAQIKDGRVTPVAQLKEQTIPAEDPSAEVIYK